MLQGHFRLSSGRHSDRYISKFRILEDPKIVEPLAAEIARAFADARPTVVVSAAVGGIVLGYETARSLGVSGIFVEKEDGRAVLRRGFALNARDRVLVVEDVVTTGLSVREVIDVVRATGAQVVGVGASWCAGPLISAFRPPRCCTCRLESYDPSECPLCAAEVPIDDPGSRRT